MQVLVYGLWHIWKCCNEAVFFGKEANPYEAVSIVLAQIDEYRHCVTLKASLVNELPRSLEQRKRWLLLHVGKVIVFIRTLSLQHGCLTPWLAMLM